MIQTYQVVISQRIDDQLDVIESVAEREGRLEEFTHAFEKILEGMRLVPLDIGESRELYRHLRLQGRHYFIGSLSVDFGVHLDEPIVFVRRFKWRSPKT